MLARLSDRLARWRGSPVEHDASAYAPLVAEIGTRSAGLERADDDELRRRGAGLRQRAMAGEPPAARLVDTFALVREVARRTVGLRPYDVQLIAGAAMQRGKLVEMQTGEGKTLAATLPVTLEAMAGSGVHVLTFNDYLARRDAAWMGPIYEFLGLRVAAVQSGMDVVARRAGYAADVTYVTAKEAGFDYLRDGLAREPRAAVQRAFGFAIVDEADSILIDEARIPLVIAAGAEVPGGGPERMAALVRTLQAGDYEVEENGRAATLTDAGLVRVERALGAGSLTAEGNLALYAQVNCALHAETLLRRDIDYIVRHGRLEHVDEFTGRVVEDRHWPDGLQAALEAKEGLRLRREGQVRGSITLQHFLRLYPRLAGMTATATPAAEEIERFYGLRTLVLPTHRPMIRVDEPDVVFTHQEAKHEALVAEISAVHASGRPILVGTSSVRESEALASRLRHAAIDCAVLNARTDESEARIVAEAGALGAVTISTNMAGRGTDIKLGGVDERQRDAVVALGGLLVLGTNRHESVRVDNQLRGRAGRQGDPGSSRFFVSLEDDLMVRFHVTDLIPAALRPRPRREPVEHPVVRREIQRGQRIIEGQSFEIRKTLWDYSCVLDEQRRIVRRRRDELLAGGEAGVLAEIDPPLYERLLQEVGAGTLAVAERRVALFHIDELWCEYLAEVADLREGIYLMRAGRRDPLAEFQQRITDLFLDLRGRIEERVGSTLREAAIVDGDIDLAAVDLRGPASTWTYLVNDDPFRDAFANLLASGGGFSALAAGVWWPLLIAWDVVRRRQRRRRERSQ